MRQTRSSLRKAAIGLAVLLALVLISGALAPSGNAAAPAAGYVLSWWTVDGGGGTAVTAGDYTLSGTAGQAGAGELAGGDYTLGGGFWGGGVVVEVSGERYVYLPLVVR